MFDYVTFDGAPVTESGYPVFQSKDGPRTMEVIHRDATDQFGAWLINEYHADADEAYRRGPLGWVRVRRHANRVAFNPPEVA